MRAAGGACEIEAAWELWQFGSDWKLAPAAVTLACFGPAFDNHIGRKGGRAAPIPNTGAAEKNWFHHMTSWELRKYFQ